MPGRRLFDRQVRGSNLQPSTFEPSTPATAHPGDPPLKSTTSLAKDLRGFLFGSWLNALLVFIPVSLVLAWRHAPGVWVFVAAALAIVPLAGLIGQATEATAGHTGPGIGGLLNATF